MCDVELGARRSTLRKSSVPRVAAKKNTPIPASARKAVTLVSNSKFMIICINEILSQQITTVSSVHNLILLTKLRKVHQRYADHPADVPS
jgi:hypothetical protein